MPTALDTKATIPASSGTAYLSTGTPDHRVNHINLEDRILELEKLVVGGVWVNGQGQGVPNNGISDASAATATAFGLLPAAGGAYVWGPGTYAYASNQTFGGPNTRHVFLGGMVQPANGVTVWLRGKIDAPRVQIFKNALPGQGTIRLDPTACPGGAYPEWWGAAGVSFYSTQASSGSSTTITSTDMAAQLAAAGYTMAQTVGWAVSIYDPATTNHPTGIGTVSAVNAGTSTWTTTGFSTGIAAVASGAYMTLSMDDALPLHAACAAYPIVELASSAYYSSFDAQITDASPNQPPPPVPILSTATTGGHYSNGTYYVRGVNRVGANHSQLGPEAKIVLAGGTATQTLAADFGGAWTSAIPVNITQIDVYVDTASNSTSHLQGSITTGASQWPGTVAYNSSGAAGPTTNTATVPGALQGAALRLSSNAVLRGQGRGRTTFRSANSSANGIYAYASPGTPCTNVSIRDMTLHMPMNANADPLKCVNVTGLQLDNLESMGGDYGAQIMGCKDAWIRNCVFHDNLASSAAGLSISEQNDGGGGYPLGTTDLHVEHCTAYNIAGHGLRLNGQTGAAGVPQGVYVSDWTAHTCTGSGIQMLEWTSAQFSGTHVWLSQFGVLIERCRRVHMLGTKANLNQQYGIYVNGSQDCKLLGGEVMNNNTSGGGFGPGIYLNDDTDTAGVARGSTGCTVRDFTSGNDPIVAQMFAPAQAGPYPMLQTNSIYEQGGGLTGNNLIDSNFCLGRGHTSADAPVILGTSRGTNY